MPTIIERLNKDKKGQSRSRSGADYHADSRDNVESQEPVSVSEDDDSDVADQEEVRKATNRVTKVAKENKIDDELISSHFNDTELDKIDYATGPHVPDLSDQIAEFLYDFVGKTSLKEIRETIKSKMFESRNSRRDNERHAWFNCHIWKVIFDQAFKNIDVISVVSLGRERRKMGRRGDWIVRSVTNGDKHEFGTGEARSVWTDNYGTKFFKEAGFKVT
ncbi:hypothetical protein F8M41_017562 [Gigaspora margarita]|uniref:Uncharacterized protein n=1 Tax=Gigaspora margarita TaxID=4874 RepID=A0A8H4ELZ6_GIGMA|nr:hypothetical protein F8M41_017562 [Gigaspora margarita]